jgi:hypothetical protein
VSRFRELHRDDFDRFLQSFSMPGTLRFRNNKWIGMTRDGKPFVVHVKHGSTRKYSPALVEAVARDLRVSAEEFSEWWSNR